MRIVVDVTPLSLPPTGIGQYMIGSLRGLAEASEEEHEIVAFGPAGPRSRQRIASSLAGIDVERRLPLLFPYAHAWRTAWSKVGRPPVETFVGDLDVFHFSDWMYPAQRGGLRSTVFADLIPLLYPDWVHPRTRRMHTAKARHAARTCDVVVAISQFTADEVVEHLDFPQERVFVAHPGVDERFQPGTPEDPPYVFTVLDRQPRKNLDRLIDAFEMVRVRRKEVRLVVAGAQPDSTDPPEMQALGYVSSDELARLHRGATVFAYPSFYEGFGMPIVEAMASGVPVVASSHPSMAEACGDAAVRVEPGGAEAIAAGIERALVERDILVRGGLEHARRFTWRACGEAHLHCFATAS